MLECADVRGAPSVTANLKYLTRLLMRSHASRISSLLLDTSFGAAQYRIGNDARVLTSAQVAKNISPPATLFNGPHASEDCARASKAQMRVSFAISPKTVRRFAPPEVLWAPVIGSGVMRITTSLANSASLYSLVSFDISPGLYC